MSETFVCDFCEEEREKNSRIDDGVPNYYECTGCVDDGLIGVKFCYHCHEYNDSYIGQISWCPVHIHIGEHKDNSHYRGNSYETLSDKYQDLIRSITNQKSFKLGEEEYQSILLLSRNIKPAKRK